ncbi:hypothetical protein [Pandoravirus japonicus]|uniref:Uncharacterized protein n=1 Tax=Pandoravirus japonicus TaxID=2823154 RepID=A0A811BMD6_9VIRU|nr:hypothetical protein [Pandoravirus japonicus]
MHPKYIFFFSKKKRETDEAMTKKLHFLFHRVGLLCLFSLRDPLPVVRGRLYLFFFTPTSASVRQHKNRSHFSWRAHATGARACSAGPRANTQRANPSMQKRKKKEKTWRRAGTASLGVQPTFFLRATFIYFPFSNRARLADASRVCIGATKERTAALFLFVSWAIRFLSRTHTKTETGDRLAL